MRLAKKLSKHASPSNNFNIYRLYVQDALTSRKFLIDTGANVSVIPPTNSERYNRPDEVRLFAANGSAIATYGRKQLKLNLGLRRNFTWNFIIAKVISPILGADFLQHFGLLVDARNSRLLDTTTSRQSKGVAQLTGMSEVFSCVTSLFRCSPKWVRGQRITINPEIISTFDNNNNKIGRTSTDETKTTQNTRHINILNDQGNLTPQVAEELTTYGQRQWKSITFQIT